MESDTSISSEVDRSFYLKYKDKLEENWDTKASKCSFRYHDVEF